MCLYFIANSCQIFKPQKAKMKIFLTKKESAYLCFMYVCVCVCMYVCIYVRTYICTYVCICMYVYVFVFVCMYVYMYVCMYMYAYVCVCPSVRLHGTTAGLLMNTFSLIFLFEDLSIIC